MFFVISYLCSLLWVICVVHHLVVNFLGFKKVDLFVEYKVHFWDDRRYYIPRVENKKLTEQCLKSFK